RSHLQTRLLERARRLDLGYGRRRVGICIHAGRLSQTPRRDRSAGRRARILARSEPGERKRASLFAGGRLAGARGDAKDVVRKTADTVDGFRGRACAAGRRRGGCLGRRLSDQRRRTGGAVALTNEGLASLALKAGLGKLAARNNRPRLPPSAGSAL